MRNRLVHGYASVDHDIVWDVVSDDLAGVIGALEELLPDTAVPGAWSPWPISRKGGVAVEAHANTIPLVRDGRGTT